MLGLRSRDSAARAHTGAARPPRPRAARPRRDEDAPHTGSAPTGVAWPAPSRPPDEARYGWRVRHPSRVHQRSLPREVALREGAVVLAEEGDTLYLAVARPDDSRLAASLASAARRPVRLVAAGSDELAHALAVCWDFQAPSTVSAQEERLAALARTVGVGYLLDPRGPRPGDPRGGPRAGRRGAGGTASARLRWRRRSTAIGRCRAIRRRRWRDRVSARLEAGTARAAGRPTAPIAHRGRMPRSAAPAAPAAPAHARRVRWAGPPRPPMRRAGCPRRGLRRAARRGDAPCHRRLDGVRGAPRPRRAGGAPRRGRRGRCGA